MKHHMKFGANPRLLAIPLMMALLLGAGGLFYVQMGALVGLIAIGIALFLDFRLGKLLASMLASGIETTAEGANIQIRSGKRYFLPKAEITVAGLYSDEGRPAVFLYAESSDHFFACADIFTHFEELEAWLRANAPFEDHRELSMSGVKEMLKQRYGDEEGEAEDAETPAEKP